MEALFMPAATMFYRGQFAEARDHCEQALAAYDDRERTIFWTASTGHNAGVTHRNYLSLALWHLGDPDEARKLDGEARPSSPGRSATPTASAMPSTSPPFLAYYCRLGPELLQAADEELTLAAEQSFELWQAWAPSTKGRDCS